MVNNLHTAINGTIILIRISNGYMKHSCYSSYYVHLMEVCMYIWIGALLIMPKLYWMKFLVRILVQTVLASKMRLSGITNQEDAHKNATHVNTIQFSSTVTQSTIAFMGKGSE